MENQKRHLRNALLRKARLRRRWTQQRLAAAVGVSVTTISRWESGVQRPALHYLDQLTATLGVSALGLGLGEEPIGADRLDSEPAPESLHAGLSSRKALKLLPELEINLIERTAEERALLGMLTAGDSGVQAARVVSMRGPGGFGKTTLAKRVCHEPEVQSRFPDGVLWLETGPDCTPTRVVQLIADLCVQLGVQRPDFTDADQAGYFLAQVLAQRKLLIVIDNVWSAQDLNPFLAGGPNCARLVTTQNAAVCPRGGAEQLIGPMSDAEIERLLTFGLPGVKVSGLVSRCGGWPLLAQVVSAAVRRDVDAGASPEQALQLAERDLRVLGPHAFDVWDSDQRLSAIGKATHLGLQRLGQHVAIGRHRDLRERFLSLAVFPPAEPIPVRVLASWWRAAHGWTEAEVRRFCHELVDRSLVARYNAKVGTISLQDVLADYLRSEVADELEALNRSLLDALRLDADWLTTCRGDPYLLANLSHHLFGAGLVDELLSLLGSLGYLLEKVRRLGALSLQSDLRLAAALAAGGNAGAQAIERLLRDSFLVHGMNRPADILATLEGLIARLGSLPEVWTGAGVPDTPFEELRMRTVWWGPVSTGAPHRDDLGGHIGAVTSLAIGRFEHEEVAVSGGEDGTVRLWSIDQLTSRNSMTGHAGWVDTVALSEPQLLLASAGEDQAIRLWSAVDGALAGVLIGHSARVRSMSFTSSGRQLISGAEDGQVILWDVARQRLLEVLDRSDRRVWTVAISPDEDLIVVGGEGSTLRSLQLQNRWPADGALDGPPAGAQPAHAAGHADWIRSAVFSPDGARIVTGSGDGTVGVWSLEPEIACNQRLPAGARVRSVAQAAKAPRVAAGCEDGNVRVWDLSTFRLLTELQSGADWVRSVAFMADGERVLGACEDGIVRVWNVASGELLATLGEPGPVGWSLAWLVSDQLAAIGTASGRIEVRDASSGERRSWLEAGSGRVWSLSAAVVGPCLAAACGDGTVRLWNPGISAACSEVQHSQERAWSVALDHGGSYLAAGFGSGRVCVWDLQTSRLLLEERRHSARVRTLAFEPAGSRLLSGSGDGTLRLWDMRKMTEPRLFDNRQEWVRAVAIDNQSRYVAAGSGRGSIRIWDADDGRLVVELLGHTGRVLDMRFSTAGDRLLSGAADGTVRLWDVAAGIELCRLRVDASLLACAAHPNATSMLVSSAQHVATVSVGRGSRST